MDELYRKNAQLVYHFLYSMCRDENIAEELTQETFLQAFQSIDRFDGSCKISTWLCQIAKHKLYQYYSKHNREIPASDSAAFEKETTEAPPERQILSRIELLDVLKDMQKLPSQMREVIYLRISGDLSFREIGEIMGKSENWARVNFFRGKEILLKEREKHE